MAKKGWERPPMTKKRFKNQVLNVIGNPFNMIVFFTLILLFITIVIPLLSMVQNTFVVAKSELRNIPGSKVGDYTLWYWKYLLASPLTKTILWVPLRNSLIIGVFVTVISVPLGALMAWLMVRTDIPAKGLLSALILIPYMIPSWCKALAWMTIFRNPSMGGNGVLSSLGITVPNALASGFASELSKESIAETVRLLGFDGRIRGEELGIAEFARLSDALGAAAHKKRL